MRFEDAPPGMWQWPVDRTLGVAGVELESVVPTRFFQTLDAYPPAWGRLRWRLQLNKLASGRATVPTFRTFYSGVEWNLRGPDPYWFLTAWFAWEGRGPRYRELSHPGAVRVEGDTALFRIAWMPKSGPLDDPDASEPDLERPLYLRSRVDARDRRRISDAVRSQAEHEEKTDAAVIVLDDLIEGEGPGRRGVENSLAGVRRRPGPNAR
jgi:hypothetical protein